MTESSLRPGAAAASVLVGMAMLGLTDNFVPFLTERGSLWQFHLIRGAMALVLLAIIAALGFGVLRPKSLRAVLGRSFFQAGAMLIYFGCLALMPIGVVVAGIFTSPLFVLLITVIFQGKRVGPVRWGAVVLGFLGTLLVIRPDPSALDPIAFLPVFAGLLYAIGAVATRAWCAQENTLTLTTGFFGMLMLFGLIGVLLLPAGGPAGHESFPVRGWVPIEAGFLFWTAVQAVGSLLGIGLIFRGYLMGEAGHVAVFEYSLLVFATFWAWVLWDQQVPMLALVGMTMIACAGVIIALRTSVPTPLRVPRVPQ